MAGTNISKNYAESNGYFGDRYVPQRDGRRLWIEIRESFEQAMEIADEIVGEEGKVAFLPNGVEIICS